MEKLYIHHFGPVKDLNVYIQPLTVFIGTQGCGKSTISKLLTICRDMSWILRLLEVAENLKEPFGKFCIDEFFYSDTEFRYESDNFIGHYVITYLDGQFSINVFDGSPESLASKISLFLLESNRSLLNQLGVTDLNAPEVKRKYSEIINSNSRVILYVPAERNLAGTLSSSLASMIAAKVPLYDALLEYMSVFEKAKNSLKEYEVPFLNAKFTTIEGKERIVLHDPMDDIEKLLPLQACSSGIQSVMPLVMVIDYALQLDCFNSFVIEEPEQNLYPSNQRELLSFLIKRFDHLDGSIITTHSPYILSCLNVMILAWRIANEFANGAEMLKEIYSGPLFCGEQVAVYALDQNDNVYCKSLIDPQTHLVGINGLDAVSDIIGDEYDRLFHLYIKLKRNK